MGERTLPLSPWGTPSINLREFSSHVHELRDDHFLQDGWYFEDETHDYNGPFVSFDEAVAACVHYCKTYL